MKLFFLSIAEMSVLKKRVINVYIKYKEFIVDGNYVLKVNIDKASVVYVLMRYIINDNMGIE